MCLRRYRLKLLERRRDLDLRRLDFLRDLRRERLRDLDLRRLERLRDLDVRLDLLRDLRQCLRVPFL